MTLTRNTKLYKSSDGKDVEIIYRTLNVTEISVLDNINHPYTKAETAYELGYISGNEPNFFSKHQIGLDIIKSSTIELNNATLLGLTVDDFRASVKDDQILTLSLAITNTMNISFEYLQTLTYLDLIELGALCESITNKKIFTVGGGSSSQPLSNKTVNDDGSQFFQDDGKSLQDKMKEMQDF